MITELEKQFYKIFEIEPKMLCNCEFKNLYDYRIEYGSDVCDYTESKIKEPCKICKKAKQKVPLYPEITDRRLLEMICIFSQHCNFGRWNKYAMHSIDDFKYIMLSQLIEYQKKRYTYGIKEKIQQLFKEKE